jgi:hypothetical protein
VPNPGRRGRALLTAGALLVTSLVAYVLLGAHAGPRVDGPLYAGGEGGLVCLQKRPETAISFGFNLIRNPGTAPIVLRGVHLVAPVALTMVSAEVVPVTNNLIGAVHGYPPPAWVLDQPGVDWAARRPLAGATLAATADLTVVVRLALGAGEVAGLDALRIDYEVNGTEYEATTTVRLRIRPTCEVPDRATYG